MVWSQLPKIARDKAAPVALMLVLACASGLANARGYGSGSHERGSVTGSAPAAIDTVSVDRLPVEARETMQLIRRGGPFPFEKDGVVFGNRERLLARRERGYYHEYTVPTPRARNRGARRIVCGGPATAPEKCFYSGNHYSSFREIADESLQR
jgi:ribonuclease T1